MASVEPELNHTMRDALKLLLGCKIGIGQDRDVYQCALNHNWVVKVEDKNRSYQNVVEWEIWNAVRGSKLERWFAPCHHISPDGRLLIMEKTDLPPARLPRRLPAFMTDAKANNFGTYSGRLVIHDYGWLHAKTFDAKLKDVVWEHRREIIE